MTERTQLIKKAKANIEAAASSATPSQAARIRAGESDDERLSLLAEFVAVFEEANTPTDDEREALERIVFQCSQARLDRYETADVILGHGFHRTVQGEPATEPASELEVPGDAPTGVAVQGEPSDAAVIAALNAYQDRRRMGTSLGDWGSFKVDRMRAALRAAASTGGQA
jgi:hypothetical protein